MKSCSLHSWNLTPKEAMEVQQRLRGRVERDDRVGRLRRVAGVDVGLDRSTRRARAAVAVLSWPELELEEWALATRPMEFPYVPGLLSFREIPAVLDALKKLKSPPDLLVCDGQGYAHPRRFGLACHLGVLTDRPAIGVGKSRLVGSHGRVPVGRGGQVPLIDDGETVGVVLRTRSRVTPVFVSVGHRVSLEAAVELTLALTPRYRLPETTRWAHRLAAGETP